MNYCYIINDYKLEHKHSVQKMTEDQYVYDMSSKYVYMLIMSLKTLFKFYNENIDNVYIICDNMNISSDKYIYMKDEIDKLNKAYDNKIIIKEVNVNEIFEKSSIKYPVKNINSYKIGKIGLIKFLLPDLIDVNNLLYIDCDVLFNGNIYDILFKDITDDTLFKFYSDTTHGPYPNSGLIYINFKLYKKYNILQEVINYYKNTKNIELVDNSCFTFLYNKFKNICPISINRPRKKYFINYTLKDPRKFGEKYAIIHIKGVPKNRYELFETLYNKIMNL